MGLRLMLDSQNDMEVVGEAADGARAVSETIRLKPDVVLMDLTMGVHSGVAAIAEIVEKCPEAKVLVLTMHAEPGYLRTALAAGATGYVIKNSDDRELLSAIREVTQGKRFVDHSLDASVLDPRIARKTNGGTRSVDLLSAREREVFSLVAKGFTNQEIATRLSLSVKSVETYRARFMEKLALHTRADLVKYALDCGVLGPGK